MLEIRASDVQDLDQANYAKCSDEPRLELSRPARPSQRRLQHPCFSQSWTADTVQNSFISNLRADLRPGAERNIGFQDLVL